MQSASAASVLAGATDLPRVRYAFHSHGDAEAHWQVVHVLIEGKFSEPYKVELELVSEHDEPAKLIGKPCSLVLRREQHARCVHGIVTRIAHAEVRGRLRVTVMPALEALRHRVDSRIFQDMTVPEVVDAVLSEGLATYQRKHQSKLRRAAYPKREYIVQYRESDLAFVERLLAEEGIWYRFEHSHGVDADDCELLTLLDANEDAPEASFGGQGKQLPLVLDHDRDQYTRVVQLALERRFGATQVKVAEANWSHPEVREQSQAGEGDERSHYEPYGVALWSYDGASYTRSDATDQARMRWEQLQGRAEHLRGHGNLEELAVGMRVLVRGADELDGEWLITALHESGHDTQQGAHGDRSDYANRFSAQRAAIPLRPTRRTKPRVSGVALAHVVGPDGKPSCAPGADDIHTDEYARVRVKMTWDQSAPGGPEGTTTCWLRAAQMWSGARWGSMFLPRIGMEVVVGFIDGDPDRPLVTGCVYNGLDLPAYAPEQHKTKSYIRTHSSPGGGGYNELLFDDAKDGELVALRAQRDHLEKVLRNQRLEIGGARSEHVQGDESVDVQGTRSHTVHGADALHVEGGRKVVVKGYDQLEVSDGAHKNDHVTGQYNIVADEHFKVKQGEDELYMKEAFYLSSQGSVQLKNAGFHLHAEPNGDTTLDVGKQLTIRVGNAQIRLKSDGSITVSGTREAKLVSGGSELALKPSGAELKAATVAVKGDALVDVRAKLIKLN